MLIFNRKKVYHGFILFEQETISSLFKENGIKYTCKVANVKRKDEKKITYNPFMRSLSHERQFNYYVKRKDYPRAKELLETELNKFTI